jgi:hypothetical protein
MMRAIVMLELDRLALEVIEALEGAGVPTLLIKGPVTAQWLYADTADHPYTDVDLLVAPDAKDHASDVLADLGLRDFHAQVLGIYRPRHERAWLTPEGLAVDLHLGLAGVPERSAELAWRRLSGEAVPFDLRGRQVAVPGPTARALQLALHAADHGSGAKALRDLERGIDLLGLDVWRRAGALAAELGALPSFGAGLRRLPAGELVLRTTDCAAAPSAETVLAGRKSFPEARSLLQLVRLPRGRRWAEAREWLTAEEPTGTRRQRNVARLKVLGRLLPATVQTASAVREAHRQRPRRASTG